MTEFEQAIKAHCCLVMLKMQGMRRYYRAFTILDGRIVDCTKKLAKMTESTLSKNDDIIIKGVGFSPIPDFAQALGVSSHIFTGG